LLLIVILWTNEGEFQSSVTEISQCPSEQFFTHAMERRRKADEFRSWTAWCTATQFGVTEKPGV